MFVPKTLSDLDDIDRAVYIIRLLRACKIIRVMRCPRIKKPKRISEKVVLFHLEKHKIRMRSPFDKRTQAEKVGEGVPTNSF